MVIKSDLLTHREAMAYLNVSNSCLKRWRILGGGPQFVKLGPHRKSEVRYARSELRRFKKTYHKPLYTERTYPLDKAGA